jgi:hypothetical protein
MVTFMKFSADQVFRIPLFVTLRGDVPAGDRLAAEKERHHAADRAMLVRNVSFLGGVVQDGPAARGPPESQAANLPPHRYGRLAGSPPPRLPHPPTQNPDRLTTLLEDAEILSLR